MKYSKLIAYYIEKSYEPDFRIDQIRKELEVENIEDEEIRTIVRIVDNSIQSRALTGYVNKSSNDLIYFGAFFTILGAAITIGTYTGIINMGNRFLIAYGPFLGGLSILITGILKKNTSPKRMKSNLKK
jgi:hypothetical protein